MNSIIDIINATYRAYDSVATSTEQFWHYLSPVRTLLECLVVDVLALLTLWLSYGMDATDPLYAAMSITQPWMVGYTLPLWSDVEYLYHYCAQMSRFLAEDALHLTRELAQGLMFRCLGVAAAVRGALNW